MNTLSTEVLVIGSGAGGAVTADRLAAAGRSVIIVEEGPWVAPDAMEPFSLDEMVAKYRHRGGSAALGAPPIAYAEGRCVGGSTEINSGLWHRLPQHLTEDWRTAYAIEEFGSSVLDRYAAEVEEDLGVSTLPGDPPPSSEVLADGASKLGWRSVEFPRVFRYDDRGRGTKQTMARTLIPRATAAGAHLVPGCRVQRLRASNGRVTSVDAVLSQPDGTSERLQIQAEHVFVCAGAIHSPALLQRSGIRRRIGRGLKLHPTIKIAARFDRPLDHGEIPMHRITEFAPHLTIGGSANRRGHVALALADAGVVLDEPMSEWENFGVYYAAIRSEGAGAVAAVPGLAAPIVTYRLTANDLSRLARGLVHLGDSLLAAGATELYPSVIDGGVVRHRSELVRWWDVVTRNRSNLMTVHLTSSIRMGSAALAGTDSYGRVHGFSNLHVNDASLLPDAPGVNPQAGIMTIAARNADHFITAK